MFQVEIKKKNGQNVSGIFNNHTEDGRFFVAQLADSQYIISEIRVSLDEISHMQIIAVHDEGDEPEERVPAIGFDMAPRCDCDCEYEEEYDTAVGGESK